MQDPSDYGGASEKLVPCDLLLLRGTCIVNEAMLTGESSPQMKEAIEIHKGDEQAVFSLGSGVSGDTEVRSHVVFGGTKIIQQSFFKQRPSSTSDSPNSQEQTPSEALVHVPKPPDKGCLAFVLRTGFETSQGQLMRTILFATKRVTAGDAETAAFIAILLVFAVFASAFVLREGLQDDTRNRFKLLLHCIMIVTSVVPPELPMELSLAVTNSLAALSRSLIYCTEPFRIPYAGKVTVCCFDKTGTLTSDDLVLHGVVFPSGGKAISSKGDDPVEDIVPASGLNGPTLWVMATCQSLMNVEGKVVGDPMERAVMEGIGWIVIPGNEAVLPPKRGHGDYTPFRILQRYPFSSALRRMSVIALKVTDNQRSSPTPGDGGRSNNNSNSNITSHNSSDSSLFVMCKGAPEIIEPLLKQKPSHYSNTYLYHMSRGRRVLALAYRALDDMDPRSIRQMSRDEAEQSLIFAGFLIVDCPLKRDSRQVITELQESNHRTIMITGDSALTAADVARQLGMIHTGPEETLHLIETASEKGGKKQSRDGFGLEWVPMVTSGTSKDKQVSIPFEVNGLDSLVKKYSLSVEGDALIALLEACSDSSALEEKERMKEEEEEGVEDGAKRLHVSVKARHVLSKLAPHVTVFARVAPDHKELMIAALNDAGEVTLMCGDGTNDVGALKKAHVGVSIINSPVLEKRADRLSLLYEKKLEERSRAQRGNSTPLSTDADEKNKNAQLAQILAEVREQENDPTIVQLGDASIASPFTAKRTSVACVISVVRQGRCTLVTTLQVYKILALNCLVSAYMLSTLYLFGVKQGDLQMTIVGIAIAGLFFFVSRAEPLEKLSAERPPSRIFCLQVSMSIVLQFLVHLACLISTVEMFRAYVRKEDPSLAPDGPFHPNLINTAIFLLAGTMQVNTFTANYRGHPFMQSLTENKAMGGIALALLGLLLFMAMEIFPPLNHFLQLVPFPSPDLRWNFVGILLADTIVVHAIDKLCLKLFKT